MLVSRDRMHWRAREFFTQASRKRRRFVTTDYVLDESATLFRARGFDRLTPELFSAVEESLAIRIERTFPERFRETGAFFLRHADKKWSFTDCLSFVVMRELDSGSRYWFGHQSWQLVTGIVVSLLDGPLPGADTRGIATAVVGVGPGACDVGIHGCKSAPVHAPGRSISLHIHQYPPQPTGQARGDSEFSLSRFPATQAPGQTASK